MGSTMGPKCPQSNPKALRARALTLLGPKTVLCRAFCLF